MSGLINTDDAVPLLKGEAEPGSSFFGRPHLSRREPVLPYETAAASECLPEISLFGICFGRREKHAVSACRLPSRIVGIDSVENEVC